MRKPVLSVCMIAYNHKRFIREALDGVLMQNVNFDWEIIIADDQSSDGTSDIIREYQSRYPDLIYPIIQKNNKGPALNFVDLILAAKGEFIAYLECDDYWTDANKLQKQIDFVRENPDCTLCFHNAEVQYHNKDEQGHLFLPEPPGDINAEALLENWLIPSCSILFKTSIIQNNIDLFEKIKTHGDLAMYILLSQHGSVRYIDEVMGVYRKNSSGVTTSQYAGILHNKDHIEFCKLLNQYSDFKYDKLFKKRMADYYIANSRLFIEEKRRKQALKSFRNFFKVRMLPDAHNWKYIPPVLIGLFSPWLYNRLKIMLK